MHHSERYACALLLALCIGCGGDDSPSSSGDDSQRSSGGGSPPSTSVPPGVAAELGEPSTVPFNDLVAMLDKSAHVPKHGLDASVAPMPEGLDGLPYVPSIKVLARRDAVILYFPNIKGAAEYRAYAVKEGMTFVDTANGRQPRGAAIACAGFRQHTYQAPIVDGYRTRELLQAVEIPGFVSEGTYTIILEATASPCPFTGIPAFADAKVTQIPAHAEVNDYSGDHFGMFTAFTTALATYGNEIINGQGSMTNWETREMQDVGAVVPPDHSIFPSDPVVIARSAISVQLPFADEETNAPVIDVGPNAVIDDFKVDLTVDPATYAVNPDYSDGAYAPACPMFEIPDEWVFWTRYVQAADGEDSGPTPHVRKGLQVFQRHGRLHTSFGDWGQDVGGSISFASLRAPVQQMDATKYVHSTFRINSEATHRRYWYWTMCGGATQEELFDDGEFKIRPILNETSFHIRGANPSVYSPHSLNAQISLDPSARECLSIAQEGWSEPGGADFSKSGAMGGERASNVIRAQIHPAGYSEGIIALGNTIQDDTALDRSGFGGLGFRFKIDENKAYAGPLLEPFDQMNPLTHYNIFLRPDRLVVFINGRQSFCVDMSDRPMTMQYGIMGYGDVIYHSGLEWKELSQVVPDDNDPTQLYQMVLNTPNTSSRVWDDVGHTDMVDGIPSQFSTFNPDLCIKPSNLEVQ